MRRIVTIALAALLLFGASASARVLNEIAAIVNEEAITTYDLDRAVDERISPAEQESLGPVAMDSRRREILQGLVEESLMRQRAAELGLAVSDAEVEEAIRDVEKQNNLTREQLRQALSAQGMGFEEYRENLREQIQSFKLLGREVQSRLEVTNQEIRDYFREHIDEFRGNPFIRLSHITFPVAPGASKAELDRRYALAQEAVSRLQLGEDFARVLASYAESGQAGGGDLGAFGQGELSPAFERAVAGLQQGQVSDVVSTPEGYHVLFMIERSDGNIRHFDTVKEEISRKVIESKKTQGVKDWMEELKAKAFIEIKI